MLTLESQQTTLVFPEKLLSRLHQSAPMNATAMSSFPLFWVSRCSAARMAGGSGRNTVSCIAANSISFCASLSSFSSCVIFPTGKGTTSSRAAQSQLECGFQPLRSLLRLVSDSHNGAYILAGRGPQGLKPGPFGTLDRPAWKSCPSRFQKC